MTITLNGEKKILSESERTVAELVTHLALGYPVLVELNGVALFTREWEERRIQEGDVVELLRMVAGG